MAIAEPGGRSLPVPQATDFRLLKPTEEEGVARVAIAASHGAYPHIGTDLRQRYSLNEAVVAECFEDRKEPILPTIRARAA